MDQNQAIIKAKQFAQTAYAAAMDTIVRESRDDLAQMHSRLAARGMILSGQTVTETARVTGEQIRALIQARLDSILEGYGIYGVDIDDEMATRLSYDIVGEASQMIDREAKTRAFPAGMPPNALAVYAHALEQNVGISAAWVRVQIDRMRHMPKKSEGPSVTTIYNVQGDNARVNVNSNDHSVNVVTKSKEEFFATLKQRIESGIPEGGERQKILSAMTALQESHGQPSFARRYADFIAVAANHMALLAPFIPALTEMLHKVLS
ncbi:MAG: hypothetical protein WBV55_08460 [Candidatus Sulfotelmatobacter sp.]